MDNIKSLVQESHARHISQDSLSRYQDCFYAFHTSLKKWASALQVRSDHHCRCRRQKCCTLRINESRQEYGREQTRLEKQATPSDGGLSAAASRRNFDAVHLRAKEDMDAFRRWQDVLLDATFETFLQLRVLSFSFLHPSLID